MRTLSRARQARRSASPHGAHFRGTGTPDAAPRTMAQTFAGPAGPTTNLLCLHAAGAKYKRSDRLLSPCSGHSCVLSAVAVSVKSAVPTACHQRYRPRITPAVSTASKTSGPDRLHTSGPDRFSHQQSRPHFTPAVPTASHRDPDQRLRPTSGFDRDSHQRSRLLFTPAVPTAFRAVSIVGEHIISNVLAC